MGTVLKALELLDLLSLIHIWTTRPVPLIPAVQGQEETDGCFCRRQFAADFAGKRAALIRRLHHRGQQAVMRMGRSVLELSLIHI